MHIISITDVLSFRQEKLGERTRSEISFTRKKDRHLISLMAYDIRPTAPQGHFFQGICLLDSIFL